MSFANKRNRKGKLFSIDTNGFSFVRLEELQQNHVYPVCGVHNFKTKYGDSPVIISVDCFVNLPKRMADDIYDIMNDETDVRDINDGRVGFKVRKYIGRDGLEHLTIDWVDR